jgi:hypothetical protein
MHWPAVIKVEIMAVTKASSACKNLLQIANIASHLRGGFFVIATRSDPRSALLRLSWKRSPPRQANPHGTHWFLSYNKKSLAGLPWALLRRPTIMTPSTNSSVAPHAFADTDPELGMYDIRIFWLAALMAIVAVLAVAYFKMGY